MVHHRTSIVIILFLCLVFTTDPIEADSWNAEVIDIESLPTGDKEVIVAVIDTGIDLDHPAFAGHLWNNTDEIADNGIDDDDNGYIDDTLGWDFQNDDNIVDDDSAVSHGTHVSGIIAAEQVGLSTARIMPLKAFDCVGNAEFNKVAEAIRYATDNNADIISMSMGGITGLSELYAAVRYADDHGVVLVAASGNGGLSSLDYPAKYTQVISVGAINENTEVSSFSNYGSDLDVVAPGELINSTVISGQGLSSRIVSHDVISYPMEFSLWSNTTISAKLIDGGDGTSLDDGINGSIVLLRRGGLNFAEMAQTISDLGGQGMVVYNDKPGMFAGTLQQEYGIYALSIAQADGILLLEQINTTDSIDFCFKIRKSDYFLNSGTSMVVPHVSAVIARLQSSRSLNASQIRHLFRYSCIDLPGNHDGYGLVNTTGISAILSDDIAPAILVNITEQKSNELGLIEFSLELVMSDNIGLDYTTSTYLDEVITRYQRIDHYGQKKG